MFASWRTETDSTRNYKVCEIVLHGQLQDHDIFGMRFCFVVSLSNLKEIIDWVSLYFNDNIPSFYSTIEVN